MSHFNAAWRMARGLAMAVAAVLSSGCSVLPLHPFMKADLADSPCASAHVPDPHRTTPEVPPEKNYTLHFVEFDDQGWAFPDGVDSGDPAATPSRQIDCAIADLRHKLEAEDANVLSFVYVHGWKHSADNDDRDVRRFRALLASRAALFPDRRIVGIYVGWQGKTVDVWGLNNLTFWGRKNAAHHVSEGRVRELFSRIRGLRAYWNGPRNGNADEHDCDWQPSGNDRCRLRTIMIGHSFGGLILFNSAAPYLLEMLSIDRDLPPGARRPRAARARGIADLIVLLNPAFEGSRYEPLFDASQNYKSADNEPPLMVMLTSTADLATKNAFPAARWFNSLFQYPASSTAQSAAMRRTPGHTDRYLTHELCLQDEACDSEPIEAPAGDGTLVASVPLRRYCGGLVLRTYKAPDRPFRPVIWNVRTHESVIPDHNSIDRPQVLRFIEQVYGDVTGLPGSACDDVYDTAQQSADPQAPPAP